MAEEANQGTSVGSVLLAMKEELKEFAETRLEMLKTELREKLKIMKIAGPLLAIGVVLLGTAYLLLTLALVGLALAFLQGNPFRWFLAFLAVGFVWALLGAIVTHFAVREFQSQGLMPKRTIAVLKGDKVWIQSEVKGHV
ncbi:MAG TPA: phage holin family protein [Candidatus Aquilonibacter sp.]|nr:phage holin family protein [Candidatus Aquilonibacter sp.]